MITSSGNDPDRGSTGAVAVTPAFTPGPWEARGGSIFREGEQALTVAIITKWQAEHKANAALIAAAPELYEALKALDALWTEDIPHGPGEEGEPRIFAAETLRVWRVARAALAKAEAQQ